MPSKSKQQQKFMGIVRAIQKGDEPASKFSKDAQDAADDMKKKDVEKFASTKHKGLPKKVEQALREKIRTMVEDYVESCGYVVSAKDPNYKLKSPGGTGEEDRELKDEGFGGELPKTEKKKFEKERLENAEVLGYTLTGTKDLKEAVDEGDFISAIQSIQAGLDEAEYGFNDLGRLKGMSSSEKRIVKTLFSRFKVLMRGVEKARRVITRESINEDGHTDVPSAVRKLKTSIEDALQIIGHLKKVNDAEPLPSWWTDKVTLSANYLNSARNYILNPHESVFAVRQDKIKNGERFPKKPNFDYDPEKGKSRIKKVNENILTKQLSKMINEPESSIVKFMKKTGLDEASLLDFVEKLTRNNSRLRRIHTTILKKAIKGDKKSEKSIEKTLYGESVNESMSPSAIKKMRDEFEKTGQLPPHLKRFALDLKILKKKHKVKNIVVPGLEWMSDMKEQSVNEARLNPKETIKQLGGNRFLYMVGAKNLAIDKPRNELHMKIMRNAKGVSHVVVRLTSLDLYDMKFLSIRAGKIRVKATEKGVYGDQLATFFKKHTGLNTRL